MATKYLPLLLLFLAACGNNTTETTETADNLPQNQVELSASQLAQIEFKVDTLAFASLGNSIAANGMIDVPPQNRALIHPPVGAYVQDLRVKVGQRVRKGEVLAILEHPDVLELQRRYLDAKAQYAFQQKEFGRQEELSREQATAQRQLDKARADLASAAALQASLEAQLNRLGIDAGNLKAENLHRQLQLKAPFEGFITQVDAQLGQFVGADKPVLAMLNKEHLHVELEVFERDLGSIQNGQKISFSLTNMPGKTYTGDVFLVGQTLDPVKRSVMVHGHIDQESDPILRPGLFVTARLLGASSRHAVLPETALVRVGEQEVAFRELAKGKFERVVVEVLQRADGQVGIAGEFVATSRWVTQGAHRLEAAWQARFAEE
jgi:cobalt-zinc-cadmium efflux system membrane fusion protein